MEASAIHPLNYWRWMRKTETKFSWARIAWTYKQSMKNHNNKLTTLNQILGF